MLECSGCRSGAELTLSWSAWRRVLCTWNSSPTLHFIQSLSSLHRKSSTDSSAWRLRWKMLNLIGFLCLNLSTNTSFSSTTEGSCRCTSLQCLQGAMTKRLVLLIILNKDMFRTGQPLLEIDLRLYFLPLKSLKRTSFGLGWEITWVTLLLLRTVCSWSSCLLCQPAFNWPISFLNLL